MNKIRSYSPQNRYAAVYNRAGDTTAWGEEIFNDALKKYRGKS